MSDSQLTSATGNNKILVVGSTNIDFVTRVARFPSPGETLMGSDYETHHGGKGANQAVAAARMGAKVSFLGCVGRDEFGRRLRRGLMDEGIDTRYMLDVDGPSGAAFITLDESRQNTIIVAPGANARLRPNDLTPDAFEDVAVVVVQQEIPTETVVRAIDLGRGSGATVVVNAAPAGATSADELAGCDLLVVNETEASRLLSHEFSGDSEQMLEALAHKFPAVVLTLGSAGLLWRSGEESDLVPGHPVEVVDTTAAGDALIGAVTAALARGERLDKAAHFGNIAGALAVTKPGAQPSLPRLDDVEALYITNSAL